MSQQWWVYMVQTVSGKLYTGISTDVDRRFAEHKAMRFAAQPASGGVKNKGAKFFYSDPAVAIVYREKSGHRSDACKREAQIKKLSRKEKCRLADIK